MEAALVAADLAGVAVEVDLERGEAVSGQSSAVVEAQEVVWRLSFQQEPKMYSKKKMSAKKNFPLPMEQPHLNSGERKRSCSVGQASNLPYQDIP